MNTLSHISHKPSLTARALAPLARVWQKTQDWVAKLLGLKNANTASIIIGGTGLVTMGTSLAVAGILGPAASVLYGLGTWVALIGAGGFIENKFTKWVANRDGNGGK